MYNLMKRLSLLFVCIGLFGCVAASGVKQEPIIVGEEPIVTNESKVDNSKVLYRNQSWDGNEGIEVECKSASKLGCRHKGRVYPWNAWLDIKGYNAKEYDMKEVIQDGNRATVVIMKR